MPPKPLTPRAPRRTFTPKYAKPPASWCDGCDLAHHGVGYVPHDGPAHTPIVLVGESPWWDEVAQGAPFMGAAGSMLTRVLRLIGKTREAVRIDNACRCLVPDGAIEKWPGAIARCGYLTDHLTAAPPQVVVPMGSVALRKVLGLAKGKHVGVETFHGTVTRDPTDRFWVVPTFHPSYLQRGATNLMGVAAFNLQRAFTVAAEGWAPDPATVVLDPPLDWFRAWAQGYLDALAQDGPFAYPLAVDIETPDKGADEGAILATGPDHSYQITRVNLSYHPDEGITVPADPAYWAIICQILAAGGVQYFWFKGFDYPRLAAAGARMDPTKAWDVMWMAKVLQSDLPMGLGFHAPFHSTYGAWKHLAETEPARYAAIDGFQTRRVGDGCVSDLHQTGQWGVFERHLHDFHRIVLQPATDIGVPVDRARLLAFKDKLDADATRLLGSIADGVPADLCPCVPKEGLTRPPLPGEVYTKARATKKDGTAKKDAPDPVKAGLYARARVVEKLVLRTVVVCASCGKVGVAKTHRCEEKSLTPILTAQPATVRRWFWQEPFNPDSPSQLLAYAKAKGHAIGKSKTTGNDSMDRETLGKLIRETEDPVYVGCLDYRAVQKVRGTYVIGTEQRLDPQDRVHGVFTFKPSTMRLCVAAGTLIEVVRDVSVHPRGIPIETVEPGMLAYTFDAHKRLTLRRVLSRVQTGTRQVIRLHWMSGFGKGRRFGWLDVTAEHRIRLYDGTYCEAQHLVQGDRTLALVRGVNPSGYARLWASHNASVLEHRFVYTTLTGEVPEHVHHVNRNMLDNKLDNLAGHDASSHVSYHGRNRTPATRAKHRAATTRRWKERPWSFGARTPRLRLTREWLVEQLAAPDVAGHPTKLAAKYRIDYSTLMKYIDSHDVVCHRRDTRPGNNHLIVFIEPLMMPVNVYDLEIEETHNFIANEVCVHNSGVNPNLQNVVADKGGKDSLAAGFRHCIVARGRWVEEGSGYADG